MKLRLQSNSVRLRLKQREVKQLVEEGAVEEAIRFFPGGDVLLYRLEISESASVPAARLTGSHVIVEVPKVLARKWADDPKQVSLEVVQPAGAPDGQTLTILVEKDFACLDGSTAQNEDTFPNPLAGTKC